MEKREITIGLGIVGVILALGAVQVVEFKLGLQEATPRNPSHFEVAQAPTPLRGAIYGLEGEDEKIRDEALQSIAKFLVGVSPAAIGPDRRRILGEGLVAYYEGVGVDTPGHLKKKREAMRLIAVKVGGEQAKNFFAEVLTFGSDPMKVVAARELSKHGAVRDKELFEMGFEVAKSSAFPNRWKAKAYRRFLGRKAAEPVLLEFFQREGLDGATLRETAVELQNYGKHEIMGQVLSRLDEAGLLENSSRMPWISGKLLAEHIRHSTGDELLTALRVVKRRNSLMQATVAAVQDRLGDASPLVRRLVAKMIPDGIASHDIDAASGELLLTARLQIETDPDVKRDIESSLEQVRSGPANVASP